MPDRECIVAFPFSTAVCGRADGRRVPFGGRGVRAFLQTKGGGAFFGSAGRRLLYGAITTLRRGGPSLSRSESVRRRSRAQTSSAISGRDEDGFRAQAKRPVSCRAFAGEARGGVGVPYPFVTGMGLSCFSGCDLFLNWGRAVRVHGLCRGGCRPNWEMLVRNSVRSSAKWRGAGPSLWRIFRDAYGWVAEHAKRSGRYGALHYTGSLWGGRRGNTVPPAKCRVP